MFRRVTGRSLLPTASLTTCLLARGLATPSEGKQRCPSKVPTNDELDKLVSALEKDDTLLEGVVAQMQAHHRRRLIVAGGAMEWFGKDSVAKEVERADADKDRVISPKDFDNWFACALKRKADEAASSAADAKVADDASAHVPFSALLLIALEAGLPFVGFGFLDNATMILAGDAIDHSLGFYLNCSVMASAAMGNVVSGMCGMQIHGFIEKAVQKLNFKTPILTEEQRRGRRVFLAGHLGGTVGIMTGLLLGMLPLLLIRTDEEGKIDNAAFDKWDTDKDGSLTAAEIRSGLLEVGFNIREDQVKEAMTHYSKLNTMDREQFHAMCADLRQHKHSHWLHESAVVTSK